MELHSRVECGREGKQQKLFVYKTFDRESYVAQLHISKKRTSRLHQGGGKTFYFLLKKCHYSHITPIQIELRMWNLVYSFSSPTCTFWRFWLASSDAFSHNYKKKGFLIISLIFRVSSSHISTSNWAKKFY